MWTSYTDENGDENVDIDSFTVGDGKDCDFHTQVEFEEHRETLMRSLLSLGNTEIHTRSVLEII